MVNVSDFEFIAQLVKDEAGITLEKGKEYLVQSRVEPVAKSLGFADICALVEHLRKEIDGVRRRQVVESLTTHETSFFRDQEPFDLLRLKVIPELIKKQQSSKELTIWCGASSSGQEPYSLCMLIRENFPELSSWRVRFLATDVSSSILNKAKSGVFNQIEINRGLPARFLVKYFEQKGQEWIIKPEIRGMIEFSQLNLLHQYTQIPPADLIMLRNVLIYFDIDTKRSILSKVYNVLKPHGFLFLGTAETTLNLCDSFDRIAFDKTSCYQKKSLIPKLP